MCGGAAISVAGAAVAQDHVSADAICAHTRILSSDSFEGRQPGSPAEAMTVDYIIRAFQNAGLRPGAPGGGWTQPVPVTFSQVAGEVRARWTAAGRSTPLQRGIDLTILPRRAMPEVRIANAPLFFVGHGISRPEQGWDDLRGFDVRGKVVVLLAGAPAGAPLPGHVDSFDVWTTKQAEFARRGALGVLLVQDPREPWDVTRRLGEDPQITPDQHNPDVQWGPPLTGVLSREAAGRLFSDAGLSLADMEARAARRDFRAVPIGDARLSIRYRIDSRTITSANVIGMIPGNAHPDEAFVYSAHWDGLGRATRPGRSRRILPGQGADDIYNGAVDNAVGVGTIIEIARRFGSAPPPERSVYFIAFTWEEAVHLGALAYADTPSVPLERTVGLLNFDVTSLIGRTRDITILGGNRNQLEERVTEVARRHGKSVRMPQQDAEGYYRRSDHYQFARRGVPVVFLFGGATPAEQNARTAALLAYDNAYIAERYHTVNDEWTDELDFAGVAEVADIAYDVGSLLANGRDWPDWYPGIDFRAVRDRSEAARR